MEEKWKMTSTRKPPAMDLPAQPSGRWRFHLLAMLVYPCVLVPVNCARGKQRAALVLNPDIATSDAHDVVRSLLQPPSRLSGPDRIHDLPRPAPQKFRNDVLHWSKNTELQTSGF